MFASDPAFLHISFRKIDWDAFLAAVRSPNWMLMAASAFVGALMPCCRAIRWRLTVKPFCPKLNASDSILANYVGYLVNMVIPCTHEAVRCVLIHRRTEGATGYDNLVGAAVIERACDALCVSLLIPFAAIISGNRATPFIQGKGSGCTIAIIFASAAIVIVAIAFLIRKHSRDSAGAAAFFNRRRNDSEAWLKIRGFFAGIVTGLKTIAQKKHPWEYAIWTLLLWLIYWGQLFLGILAMPAFHTQEIPLYAAAAENALTITVAVAVASIIPSPGGFGAYHFTVASTLKTIRAIPWELGLAYATLVHESQTILMLICGAIATLLLRAKGKPAPNPQHTPPETASLPQATSYKKLEKNHT